MFNWYLLQPHECKGDRERNDARADRQRELEINMGKGWENINMLRM
jgi:hypothetical protein